MGKRTKTLAYGGVFAALTFVLCWLGSVSASGKFILPAVCGITLTLLLRYLSAGVAYSVYAVSSALLLLLPNRVSAYAYILLLGYYPLLCESLKKLPAFAKALIKLVLLTAVGCVTLFAGAAALGLWENPKFVKYYPLMILIYYVLAGIYDMFLWLLRRQFETRWDAKLRKYFR